MDEDDCTAYLERAAILEYMAGMARKSAERLAFSMTVKTMSNGERSILVVGKFLDAAKKLCTERGITDQPTIIEVARMIATEYARGASDA